jgi:quercetin dioxygenase-like cupin family protein
MDGQEQTGKPGQIVVIPAGVPRRFRRVQDQVTYLSVWMDPNRPY